MEIGVFSARFYPQLVGSGTYAYKTSKELVKRGHDVTIMTDSALKPQHEGRELPFRMEYIEDLENFALGKAGIKKPTEGLYNSVRGNRLDVLHVFNYMPMLATSLMRPLIDCPVVFTFYNTPNGDQRAMGHYKDGPLDVALAQQIIGMKQYDRLITGSRCYYDFAMRLGADPETTDLAYIGIDHEEFEASYEQNQDVDFGQYFGEQLEEDDYLITLPGRITANKGTMEAVEALGEIADDVDAKMLLTGLATPFDQEFKSKVLTRAAELGVEDRIIHPQKLIERDHLPALFKRSDIIITPSHHEGLGMTAIEALKMGAPLIASDTQGLNEVAYHEINSLLVPPKDSHSLAESIIRLTREPGLKDRISSAAPESVAKFNLKTYVSHFETVYNELTS